MKRQSSAWRRVAQACKEQRSACTRACAARAWSANRQPVRVVVQQRVLPQYRVPVFSALAQRDGIDLKLVYDYSTDSPMNVSAEGFASEHARLRSASLRRHNLYWHAAQWRYAGRDRCDVLVLSWDLHYASLVPALLRARLNGVPTILWGHGYSKNEVGWRKQLRQSVAQLATALMFYDHRTARRFVAAGWDPARIYVALNSLDQTPIRKAREFWTQRTADLKAFRDRHALKQGATILFVSRLLHENRIDLLLTAAADLVREGVNDLSIVLIGDGPDGARLKALAERLGIAHRLKVPGAIYDEMQLAPWFLSADIFCYPANIGLSLLHAFGYGLPVVTTDNLNTQNPEIEALAHGVNGLLYRDGDARSLAGALRGILRNSDLRQSMQAHALDTVANRFSLPNMIDGMEHAVRFCGSRMVFE